MLLKSIERMTVRELQDFVNNNLGLAHQEKLKGVLRQVEIIKAKEEN